MLFFSFESFANQCREIFSITSKRVEGFPIRKIFAGQSSVGFEYAYFKAFRDAKIDHNKSLNQLSKREKERLIKSIAEELSYSVPVIIDPSGRVFAVDQHHDMYAYLAVIGKKEDPQVPITILRDFSKEIISMAEFKEIVKKNGWVYERNLDDVLDKPMPIQNLINSVERSVVGMAFADIAKTENIPLKGKYFSPFIQFLLADLIISKNLMEFGTTYSRSDVDKVVRLLSQDNDVRRFLESHLIEDAPKELQEFLND